MIYIVVFDNNTVSVNKKYIFCKYTFIIKLY